MNIISVKQKYEYSLDDIIEKVTELLNINTFNKQSENLIKQYCHTLNNFNFDVEDFISNYDLHKKNNIEDLTKKLLKFDLNNELKQFSDGNIYNNIEKIEIYLKDDKYMEQLEIIITINIFSSFKSVRNLRRNAYPYLHQLLNKKKYSLQLVTHCPFCKDKIVMNTFTKTEPSRYNLDINDISKCNCTFPSANDDWIEYINKVNNLLDNKVELVEPVLHNDTLNELHQYAKNNYPSFYQFEDDSKIIYDEEKEFEVTSINKQIWAKIKKDDYSFNYYEINELKKTPNALINGIKIYSLKNVINNFELRAKRDYYYEENGQSCKVYKIYIEYKAVERIQEINSQLIDYVKNYKKKDTTQNCSEQDEILALGYYCKSNNITMDDICKYSSLLNFCEQQNIEYHEIREIIVQNLHKY